MVRTRADTPPSYECLKSGLNVAFQVDLQLLFKFKIFLRGAHVRWESRVRFGV